MTEPRIAPLEPPYDTATAAMLEKWMPPDAGVEPLRLFRTLLVHASLAARMRPLGAGILGHGVLEPRVRELMILRTCARCGAEYEWGVHAAIFAASVGLAPPELAATALGSPDEPDDDDPSDPDDPDDSVWSDRDRAVIRLADELRDSARVSDAAHAELERHFGAEEILELVVTAGWYHTISFVVNAAGVELEPWAARFPRARGATPGRP